MAQDWQALTGRLRSGAIGRRDFIVSATALGISAATAHTALAQTSPKRGGHLVMGISQGGGSDSFDPATWNSNFMPNFGTQCYDNLTVVDHHMKVQPSLAESWEFKPGAKVWVFKLRRGVTFHNGKALTSADVVFSLNHHRGKDSKSMAKSLVTTFEDVTASAPNEVTITLSGGNVDLPYVLADWHLQIVPENSPFDGIGTGAFVIEKFESGVRGMAKRNPNDWNKQRGHVDTVETLVINDATARISARAGF